MCDGKTKTKKELYECAVIDGPGNPAGEKLTWPNYRLTIITFDNLSPTKGNSKVINVHYTRLESPICQNPYHHGNNPIRACKRTFRSIWHPWRWTFSSCWIYRYLWSTTFRTTLHTTTTIGQVWFPWCASTSTQLQWATAL